MKHLLLLLLWGYNAGAQTVGELRFDATKIYVHGKPELIKCKHIYVAVEPDTVLGDVGSGHDAIARVGFHDGKEVICVKCHHIKNQIIDYNWRFRGMPLATPDTLKLWPNYSPQDTTGSGYKLFWHPGLRRLNSMHEAVIFGGGSDGLGKNILPGPPHMLISNLNNWYYIKGAGCITGTDKSGNTIYGNAGSPMVRKK